MHAGAFDTHIISELSKTHAVIATRAHGIFGCIKKFIAGDWGLKAKDRAVSTMRYLDGVLAKQNFLACDTFTVADITAFAGLGFADFSKIDIPAELKNLTAWRARVAARPSIAHA